MEKTGANVGRLKAYVIALKNGEDGSKLYKEYKDDLDQVTAEDAFQVFSDLLAEGEEAASILTYLGKVVNVFGHGLEKRGPIDSTYPFLQDLMAENAALQAKLDVVKGLLLDKELEFEDRRMALKPLITELTSFEDHYAKKENILFPMLEKKDARYEGSAIMWALHDQVRRDLKAFLEDLAKREMSPQRFNQSLGRIFFGMIGLIYKEEKILFPAALSTLYAADWASMYEQSMDYDFPFIAKVKEDVDSTDFALLEGHIHTDTGTLKLDEIIMILNALPVDMTYVDEHNKVRYFSNAKDRIFPRSKAVIGRDVKNCHPPASVHVVTDIVDAFRNRDQTSASFWIDVKGKKILIQYFALFDDHDNYRGVLEVSQDITQIQQLQGQRRVLDWTKED